MEATPEPPQKNESSGWGTSAFDRTPIYIFWGALITFLLGLTKKKIEKKKIETLSISTGVKNSRKSDPVDIDRRKKLPLDDI